MGYISSTSKCSANSRNITVVSLSNRLINKLIKVVNHGTGERLDIQEDYNKWFYCLLYKSLPAIWYKCYYYVPCIVQPNLPLCLCAGLEVISVCLNFRWRLLFAPLQQKTRRGLFPGSLLIRKEERPWKQSWNKPRLCWFMRCVV